MHYKVNVLFTVSQCFDSAAFPGMKLETWTYLCVERTPASHCSFVLSFLLQAYERRFPTCHLIPMFVNSDVVNEETSEDGSTQRIERRCALDVDAPRLLKRVKRTFLVCALVFLPASLLVSWHCFGSDINRSLWFTDCRCRLRVLQPEKHSEQKGADSAH